MSHAHANASDTFARAPFPVPAIHLSGMTPYLCEEIAAVADRLLPPGLYSVALVTQGNTADKVVAELGPLLAVPVHTFQIARVSLDRFVVEGFRPGAMWDDEFYTGEFPTIEEAVAAIGRVVYDRLRQGGPTLAARIA